MAGENLDYISPRWWEERKVHCWRNYISEEVKGMWGDFSYSQRKAIAENMQEIVDREEWE